MQSRQSLRFDSEELAKATFPNFTMLRPGVLGRNLTLLGTWRTRRAFPPGSLASRLSRHRFHDKSSLGLDAAILKTAPKYMTVTWHED